MMFEHDIDIDPESELIFLKK